jgi:hypothetical protein
LAPFIGPRGGGREADRRSIDAGKCSINVFDYFLEGAGAALGFHAEEAARCEWAGRRQADQRWLLLLSKDEEGDWPRWAWLGHKAGWACGVLAKSKRKIRWFVLWAGPKAENE